MNYLNTNKSLFCGTRQFSSKAMTEDEFLNCLNNFLISNDEEKIDDLSNESIYEAYFAIRDNFKYDKKDFYGIIDGLDIDMDNPLTFHRLDNGFCYIELYSGGEDEYGNSVFSILYFDENEKLRNYVPYYGNLVNILSKEAVFCYNGNDAKAYKFLTKKYFTRLESLYGNKNVNKLINEETTVINLLCLGWEYGMIGTLNHPNSYEDEEELIDLFKINKDYVLEDILSNVVLV